MIPPTAMREEIFEQADIVAMMASDSTPYRHAAVAARESGARFVILAARGSSDNACVYGQYLASVIGGLPAGLALLSSVDVYEARVDLRDCLVIGISQSGETPDVTEYMIQARDAGGFTVAITNNQESPLAAAADSVLATPAGPEQAVAATKTYTSQLAALALFWAAWVHDDGLASSLGQDVPAAMRAAYGCEDQIRCLARSLRAAERVLVTGRGYNYATALETALKLEETCYLSAMPFALPDLMHGPIAMVEPAYPVLAFAMSGKTRHGMLALVEELRKRGSLPFVVGDSLPMKSSTAVNLDLSHAIPEPLSPLVAVIPGQLLALHLSLERGLDPDKPRGLSKVTRYGGRPAGSHGDSHEPGAETA